MVGVALGVGAGVVPELAGSVGGVVAPPGVSGGIGLLGSLAGGVVPSADPSLDCANTWKEKERIKINIKKAKIKFFIYLLHKIHWLGVWREVGTC